MPTETSSVSKDTVVVITGGYNYQQTWGSTNITRTEIFPRVIGCSLPPLPEGRYGHLTFLSTDLRPKVVACGGIPRKTTSCLALDVENHRWDENVIGPLPQWRALGAAVTVENVGTYLIGGYSSDMASTTDFLAKETTEWVAGPSTPIPLAYPCAVRISKLSILVFYKKDIREYQVDVANPTSNSGWQDASKWPQLQVHRSSGAGCTMIGDKVVIAGGGSGRSISEVLDISTRTITNTGDLDGNRYYTHFATISQGGQQSAWALGGQSGVLSTSYLKSILQFSPSTKKWTAASATLEEGKSSHGAVVVPRDLVCPN